MTDKTKDMPDTRYPELYTVYGREEFPGEDIDGMSFVLSCIS